MTSALANMCAIRRPEDFISHWYHGALHRRSTPSELFPLHEIISKSIESYSNCIASPFDCQLDANDVYSASERQSESRLKVEESWYSQTVSIPPQRTQDRSRLTLDNQSRDVDENSMNWYEKEDICTGMTDALASDGLSEFDSTDCGLRILSTTPTGAVWNADGNSNAFINDGLKMPNFYNTCITGGYSPEVNATLRLASSSDYHGHTEISSVNDSDYRRVHQLGDGLVQTPFNPSHDYQTTTPLSTTLPSDTSMDMSMSGTQQQLQSANVCQNQSCVAQTTYYAADQSVTLPVTGRCYALPALSDNSDEMKAVQGAYSCRQQSPAPLESGLIYTSDQSSVVPSYSQCSVFYPGEVVMTCRRRLFDDARCYQTAVVNSDYTVRKKTRRCGDICDRSFTRSRTLRKHLHVRARRDNVSAKTHVCLICCRRFAQPSNLAAHRRTHTGERPYACPVTGCQRNFTQKSSLVTHTRTHSGERPYVCRQCGRSFADSSTLTKHIRVHTGDRPYGCDVCPATFSQSGNLSRHRRLHRTRSTSSSQHHS